MQSGADLRVVMTVAYADRRWGGHELFLCRALAQRGHDVTLVTSTMVPPRYARHSRCETLAEYEQVFGFRIVRVPAGPTVLEAPVVPKMLGVLGRLPADVYHAHETFQPATLWTALTARRNRRPLVITQHASGEFGRRWATVLYRMHLRLWGSMILRQAGRIIALTPGGAQSLSSFVSKEKLHVVPSGVDVTFFRPDGPLDDRIAQLKRPVILFAGRLVPNKDVTTLVRAFALTGQKGTLAIVGAGPDYAEVSRLCGAILQSDRYRVLDPVPHQSMPEVLRAADVFVLPSRVEPFGLVLLEAMACGTPAVAARAEGPASFMPERLLFPAGDSDALASLLTAVLCRLPEERCFALQLARNYSWDRIAAQVEELYRLASSR